MESSTDQRCQPQTQAWPPEATQASSPPRSDVASLATRIRLVLTTLESPVLSPFIVPTCFCFFFSSFFLSTYLLGKERAVTETQQQAKGELICGLLVPALQGSEKE